QAVGGKGGRAPTDQFGLREMGLYHIEISLYLSKGGFNGTAPLVKVLFPDMPIVDMQTLEFQGTTVFEIAHQIVQCLSDLDPAAVHPIVDVHVDRYVQVLVQCLLVQ